MSYLISDSVFFITGGARGIGAETARVAIKRGHKVVIADIDEDAGQACAADLGDRAMAVQLDVTQVEEWTKALEVAMHQFGRVDVIINNAGLLGAAFLDRQSEAHIRAMLDVNVWGVICGFQAGARVFDAQGFGHFATVGSITAFVPTPGQAVYAASKHAVRALHYAFEMECKERPFNFSLIHPSTANTRLLDAQRTEDAAALSFAQAPLDPTYIARKIYRTVARRRREIIIPSFQGAFSRLIGIYPGLLAMILRGAWKQGACNQAKASGDKS